MDPIYIKGCHTTNPSEKIIKCKWYLVNYGVNLIFEFFKRDKLLNDKNCFILSNLKYFMIIY